MDTDTIIKQLEYEADKHKNDRLFTGQTDITALCRDLIPKMKELKRYEDLEQDGRLLESPCKVGDIVHFIDDIDGVYERTAVVTGIEIDVWGVHIVIPDDETASVFSYYEPEEFGETIFLTKEAAEAALKEMEEKHE